MHLTRHKISDGWRERTWLRVRGGSYHKLERGAASRSLHRLVRRWRRFTESVQVHPMLIEQAREVEDRVDQPRRVCSASERNCTADTQ